MLVLALTTDTIKYNLGEAQSTALQSFSASRDITTTSYTPSRKVIVSSGVTDVTLVDAPSDASHQIVIDTLSIYNSDNITHNVYIKLMRMERNTPCGKALYKQESVYNTLMIEDFKKMTLQAI